MKTLYISRSNNILIDTENNTANKIDTQRQGIDNIYLIKEPMHIVYGCGEYHKELDADKDDIVITFYPKEFENQVIVVKSPEWLANLLEYERVQQEEKERWAKAKELSAEAKDDTI